MSKTEVKIQTIEILLKSHIEEFGMTDFTPYQVAVNLRKIFPDEGMKHKELLDYILSTNYANKRLAVLKRAVTKLGNDLESDDIETVC